MLTITLNIVVATEPVPNFLGIPFAQVRHKLVQIANLFNVLAMLRIVRTMPWTVAEQLLLNVPLWTTLLLTATRQLILPVFVQSVLPIGTTVKPELALNLH